MNPAVFLDTVGLIASWDKSDQWHDEALRSLELLRAEGARTISTTFILAGCGNAAARKTFREAADKLCSKLEVGARLIRPTEDDWDQAWVAYRRGDGGGAGIVDQISFLVMRRLGIRRAFTNDRHFRAAGFETLF